MDDVARAASLGTEQGWRVQAVDPQGGSLIVESEHPPEAFNELLVRAGLRVSRIEAVGPTLESAFLRLTGHARKGE